METAHYVEHILALALRITAAKASVVGIHCEVECIFASVKTALSYWNWQILIMLLSITSNDLPYLLVIYTKTNHLRLYMQLQNLDDPYPYFVQTST